MQHVQSNQINPLIVGSQGGWLYCVHEKVKMHSMQPQSDLDGFFEIYV